MDASAAKAALIVLMQHSLVKAIAPPKSSDNDGFKNGVQNRVQIRDRDQRNVKHKYALDYDRATLIQRYPRYVEYAKKAYEEEGAAIVEEILVKGRMGTVEVIRAGVECLERYHPSEEEATSSEESSEQLLARAQKVANALKLMVQDGYIEIVAPVSKLVKAEQDQVSVSGDGANADADIQMNEAELGQHSFDVGLKLIMNEVQFKKFFKAGAVWRVNVIMFHFSMRAIFLGQLVAERYSQVQFAGAIVSAALKYTASKEFSLKYKKIYASEEERQQSMEQNSIFTPNDIQDFLPPVVLAEMNSRAGGASANLTAALTEMSQFVYPAVIEEVEQGQGHSEGGKFEVTTRQLLTYLKGRIVHQVVKDHFGDVGARICSILEARGHLEGDAVAENAMVPAKDAREMLHSLYKANYISMLYLQQSKQHNPANAMYLWCVEKKRLHHTIQKNVTKALVNLRLRRQHEVEEGKDWIERAKLAGDTDENDSAIDKINYNKFCRGLERIDNASLQLDETLMIMKDFEG